MSDECYIGIDVSKATLAIGTSERFLGNVANSEPGYAALLDTLKGLQVSLITLEHTGCYSKPVALFLCQHGFQVFVAPPDKTRHYALSMGQIAKTDPIDAVVIAQFGEQCRHRRYFTHDPVIEELRALIDRRDQLVSDRTKAKVRLETCVSDRMRQLIDHHIAYLSEQITSLDGLIASFVDEHQSLAERVAILREISGVGLHTAVTTIAYVPELGMLNRQEIAKLVGVAPIDQSSGKKEGIRHIRGGRKRVRRALYLAVLSAVRYNAVLSTMYQRLLAKGKAKKIAMMACARKLLIYMNTQIAKTVSN